MKMLRNILRITRCKNVLGIHGAATYTFRRMTGYCQSTWYELDVSKRNSSQLCLRLSYSSQVAKRALKLNQSVAATGLTFVLLEAKNFNSNIQKVRQNCSDQAAVFLAGNITDFVSYVPLVYSWYRIGNRNRSETNIVLFTFEKIVTK